MLNDRDDKVEGEHPEESEYHFSDEDVSYDVEDESASTTPEAPAPKAQNLKQELVNRLNRSRRPIIASVVFLILVFVVYKMVAPTSTPPSNTITPIVASAPGQPITPAGQTKPTTQAALTTQAGGAPAMQQATTPMQATAPAQTTQAAMQASNPPMNTPAQQMPAVSQQTAVQPTPTQPMPGQQAPGQQMAATNPQMANMPVMPVQSPPITAPPSASTPPPPITSAAPTAQMPPPPLTQPSQGQTLGVTSPTGNEAAIQSELTQLNAEYAQRITEFNSQNKNLQDEVQILNNRVASMETQMNQLIQSITRQQEQVRQAMRNEPPPPPPPQQSQGVPMAVTPHVPYNVQAIIPGRAWLKSDSGETVTVAEGDIVKDLGKITRIDPYDGIVEVNTGTKVISLSYGNGG